MFTLVRPLSSAILLSAVLSPGMAFAQAASSGESGPTQSSGEFQPEGAAPETRAAPPAPSSPEPVSSAHHEQWQRDYTRARAQLIAGQFAVAAQKFRALAAAAEDPFDRRLALEQSELASAWSDRRLVLSAAPDARVAVSLADSTQRSTDEISILYTNAAVYGIGSGIALAMLTEPDSAAGGILPTLGLAGAALGGVALADMSPHELRYGVPQSIVSGMYIGLEEGITWALWNQARARYDEQWEGSTVSTLIWTGATLGAGIGAVVGSLRGTTPGRASFVGSSALWVGAIAGLTAGAFGSEDDDTRDDHSLLAAAIGVNAGAVVGMLAAGPVSPSIARVRFLDLGAVGGGLVFGGLYLAAADKDFDSRTLMAATALGMGAGLVSAWLATNGMRPDFGPAEAKPGSVVQSLRPTFAPAPGGGLLALNGTL